MSKRRNYNRKEFDELQKLRHQNDKLKKQVSSLRKQITKLDIDRYENIKDLINKYDTLENEEVSKVEKEKIDQKWSCFECGEGLMQIHTVFKLDGQFYYRKCSSCSNRTKLKPYKKDVQGVYKNEEDKE